MERNKSIELLLGLMFIVLILILLVLILNLDSFKSDEVVNHYYPVPSTSSAPIIEKQVIYIKEPIKK